MKTLPLILILSFIPLQARAWVSVIQCYNAAGGSTCTNDCSGNYGTTGEGAGYWNFLTNQTVLTKIAVNCSSEYPTIAGYLKTSGAATAIHWVIYEDDAGDHGGDAGEPYTLLWSADDTTSSSDPGSLYSKATSAACLNTDSTNYVWIGVQGETSGVYYTYTSSSGTNRAYTSSTFTVESPWPHGSDSNLTRLPHFYLTW